MKPVTIVTISIVVMLLYFFLATPVMNDDGFQYEGFTKSLAHGVLDFRSFYGFHGLSILSVPIYWITRSDISIIITSAILYLLSLPLAYLIGQDFYKNKRAGIYFLILILLMPYTYTTMMRGFQEAALLFFVLLVIYSSINRELTTPVYWAISGIVKPFSLTLFPLFMPLFSRLNLENLRPNLGRIGWLLLAFAIGGTYLGLSYHQTGHLLNNAAINSYQGNFDNGHPPPLAESFTIGIKGYLRVGANLLLSFRKIMISPLVIILGALTLLLNKNFRLRKEIILAIVLNFLLVGSLTFSFSKYLLPMVVLLALASVNYLMKYKWLMLVVFADSFLVFLPIWNYFGHSFWPNIYIYLIPLWLALTIFTIEIKYQISKIKTTN